MKSSKARLFQESIAKILLLIFPTCFLFYFLINQSVLYFGIIGDQKTSLIPFVSTQNSISFQLSLFASFGAILSSCFYSLRFRFLPTILLLIFGFWCIYKGLDELAIGEFDSFFLSIQFIVFSVLFSAGWLIGFGFIRLRRFAILISVILTLSCVAVIAKAKNETVEQLISAFGPVLFYAVYIVFIAEQIYRQKERINRFWALVTTKLLIFFLVIGIMISGVYYLMEKEIKSTVEEYGGKGKEGKNGMLQKDKNGNFDLKDYARLTGNLGRKNDLLFCAKINNFFPNTKIPNPLYLTAFYYTKFDTLTETFERDNIIPNNDLFEPNPSKIPLYFTKTDSSVLKNGLSNKLRNTVDVEIYAKQLSPSTYLAPNTGFFVQPISIEKDFKAEFKSAYRAKGYVSSLNSAYFVYNAKEPQLQKFQAKRFAILRTAKNYANTPEAFMKYYTFMPKDVKFQRIANLAQSIAGNKTTTVDKVLALRDWFMSKDSTGKPLFKYTDNPGIPDIPSASKLNYFLFENRKGYCAYYAGATLFMLRALGIPSRIAVGFMTVDRSDKNKGWYWYYADQAHAWVQVYFPEFGWLDFDTTVGNSDAEESPSPDGTPPTPPQKAILASEGIITNIDTLKKQIVLKINQFMIQDKTLQVEKNTSLLLNLKNASIKRDSISLDMRQLKKNEIATVISFDEKLNLIEFKENNLENIIGRLPIPTPINEVIVYADSSKSEKQKELVKNSEHNNKIKITVKTLIIEGIFILILILLLPTLIHLFFKVIINNGKHKINAYWRYQHLSWVLHLMGKEKDDKTPLEYAVTIIDPFYGTNFQTFITVYNKLKYAQSIFSSYDKLMLEQSYEDIINAIFNKHSNKEIVLNFIKTKRAIVYFV